DLEIHGARGSRLRFLADVARAMPRVTPDTQVVCSHLHLAPAARMLSWRGRRPTIILCGIEAWVALRPAEHWAISGGEIVAISQHTVDRFRIANPALASIDIAVCHPGLPARPHGSDTTPVERPVSQTALIVARM